MTARTGSLSNFFLKLSDLSLLLVALSAAIVLRYSPADNPGFVVDYLSQRTERSGARGSDRLGSVAGSGESRRMADHQCWDRGDLRRVQPGADRRDAHRPATQFAPVARARAQRENARNRRRRRARATICGPTGAAA